jgi:hypothetical protein
VQGSGSTSCIGAMARSAALVAALCVHGSLGAFLSAPPSGLSSLRGMHLCPAGRPAWSESGRTSLAAGSRAPSVLQWDASARGSLLRTDSANLVPLTPVSVLLGGVLRTQSTLVTDKPQPPRRRGGVGESVVSVPVITTIPTPDVVTEDAVFVLRFHSTPHTPTSYSTPCNPPPHIFNRRKRS